MLKNHRQYIGEIGENYAINFLKEQQFNILQHHYTTHWGELDIVAQKKNVLYFIEVKTRIGDSKGKPYEAVTFYKLRSLKRAVQQYIHSHKSSVLKYSMNIISIQLDTNGLINYLNFFESPDQTM